MQRIESSNLNKIDPDRSDGIKDISRNMYDILMSKAPLAAKCFEEVNSMESFQYLDMPGKTEKLTVFGRERELYLPLLAIAYMIYKDSGYPNPWNNLIQELDSITGEKQNDEEETPEVILKNYITKVFEDEKVDEREFNMYELVKGYQNRYVESKGNGVEKWIADSIKKCNWCKPYKRLRRKEVRVEVNLPDGTVVDKMKTLAVYILTRERLGIPKNTETVEIPF
jgi:hypothetical protein